MTEIFRTELFLELNWPGLNRQDWIAQMLWTEMDGNQFVYCLSNAGEVKNP